MPIVILILGFVLASTPTLADDAAEGKVLAELNCSRCHALGSTGDSPFKDAPPFRTIHETFAEGELEAALNEVLVVAHPAMPQWVMTPDQARQLAAFIMSFGPPLKRD
jgi:mono/diheme cytochrome c family protein